ncbi:YidC/Oxa1 family membrane protein insertase [Dermatobacter hominis]|uniref:YidC/Oxa1 family membrane protein insertase n=1 Tax=Dermatobacter hominis TaxID=2884263 RepID=UPI001D1020E3|nr:YidC/Oxa1 family membrane protein insertase [Dermatobacter hominis]UDY34348.1 YidC/Oxa1 family membrane protein insertase [Dermatobacter hominis]
MFEQFFEALGSVLNFFYTLIPNYGISIMLLTVLVMVLITPLTVKSTRSMLQMQRLQPEMKRLQAKYKDDREQLNAELMKFYRENKINPLGGCLPLLAQMPVFIIMYQLLRGLTTRQGGMGSGIGHIAGQVQQGVELTPWIFTDQYFRPEHLNHSSDLYQSLSSTNTMNFFGMDLAVSAAQALKLGLLIAVPYLLLLLVILVTGVYQNRQLQARNTNTAVNPQQQMLMRIMPFFLPVFSFGFPSGLALYWATQNLCRIGTNAYITRSVYRKEHEKAPIETTAKEKVGKGKGGADEDDGSSGVGKGGSAKSSGKGAGGKGTAAIGKGAGAKRANGNGKADDDASRREGSSVRSQKARENASASGVTGKRSGSGGKRTVNPRRSGQPRGRSGTGTDSGNGRAGDGDEKE